MGHFIYYKEGAHGIAPDTASAYLDGTDLIEVLPGKSYSYTQCDGGPFGMGQGICFASVPPQVMGKMGDAGPKLYYKPEQQVWAQGPGFAVGYWTDDKPIPDDLVRPTYVPGYECPLDDGHSWIIPVIRIASGGTALPQKISRDVSGAIVKTPLERYQDICKMADTMADFLLSALEDGEEEGVVENGMLDDTSIYEIAERALGINYHVGPYEIGLLGLLTTVNVGTIAAIIADMGGLQAILSARTGAKKNKISSDTPNTEDGQTE